MTSPGWQPTIPARANASQGEQPPAREEDRLQKQALPDPEQNSTDFPDFEIRQDSQSSLPPYPSNSENVPATGKIQQYGFIVLILLAATAAFVLWSRSSATPDAARIEREAKAQAEALLFSDLTRAQPELEARLRQRISFRRKVIIIRDSSTATVYGLPASSTWKIECGLGLSIQFPGLGEDALTVELTDSTFTEDKCAELIPLVSDALKPME
jgi:hypothetical protein